MPLKIVRNDITKMNTEAIVNTANDNPTVGTGCDIAIYKAAGYDRLLRYRKEHIGFIPEGQAFITPGFNLAAKYIIHAVSPRFINGQLGEEEKLRECYRNSLRLAEEHGIKSIAFPLISTGGFGYPKEEGLRIAADEINDFLLQWDMEIFLVVFGQRDTDLGARLYPNLEEYIDNHYVKKAEEQEYLQGQYFLNCCSTEFEEEMEIAQSVGCLDFEENHQSKLDERMKHLSDTFSEYLFYLIGEKKMENAEVWKRALVDRKVFSKIKNNPDYHPNRITALCLCIGLQLNLDETRDLIARAGYALSPADKTDIIFSYFIENEIYDMIELDIQLEEHGLPCIIS